MVGMRTVAVVVGVFLGACGGGGDGATGDGAAGGDAPRTGDGAGPGSDAPSPPGAFPNAENTGVPAGTVLTDYVGPCTITEDGTTIDAQRVNCSLRILAANVTIMRSEIHGTVNNDADGQTFTIEDSYVDAGQGEGTAVGNVDFVARRLHLVGGNRSALCTRCTIEDSFVHGQFRDETGTFHESGIRMDQGSTIRHNSILCDAPDVPPDAGCSADLTGYGDFAPVENNLIEGNLFMATTGGFCAYGGSSAGKPYSDDANNIKFRNNVFQRRTDDGARGCGYYGSVTDFDPSKPGNEWTNNTYEDGEVIEP